MFSSQVAKSNSKPKELGGIAQDMCKNYNLLAEDTKYAILLTNQPDVRKFIHIFIMKTLLMTSLIENDYLIIMLSFFAFV